MAGGPGFASHGGVTLSRGWQCQRWKPLDILGTHLHSATQLLTSCKPGRNTIRIRCWGNELEKGGQREMEREEIPSPQLMVTALF